MAPTPPKYQETVITNTETVDTKQTKKRKAVAAMAVDYTPTETTAVSSVGVLTYTYYIYVCINLSDYILPDKLIYCSIGKRAIIKSKIKSKLF